MTPKLIWVCKECKRPVADGDGYLHVSEVGLAEHRAGVKRWEAEHPGTIHTLGELMDLPDDVPWQVHHHACDPNPETGDYWFSVNEVRTHAGLLRWTAHLMGKRWLDATNWSAVIRDQADRGGLGVAS